MITIKHRFIYHQVNPTTETLIIGTFNPESADNNAEFFYGRNRNYLWRLLPTAFGKSDLKGSSIRAKLDFIKEYKIDFTDLIEEIKVDHGQEANYSDEYIDDKVTQWKPVDILIDSLPYLKMVCFTRKTLSDIPNMKKQLLKIQMKCEGKGIPFHFLVTPARFYRVDKQAEWTNFLLNGSR